MLLRGAASAPLPDPTPSTVTSSLALPDVVPAPTVRPGIVSHGSVTFTWTYDQHEPGDHFQWRRKDVAVEAKWTDTPKAQAVLKNVTSACIEVNVLRADGSYSVQTGSNCGGK